MTALLTEISHCSFLLETFTAVMAGPRDQQSPRAVAISSRAGRNPASGSVRGRMKAATLGRTRRDPAATPARRVRVPGAFQPAVSRGAKFVTLPPPHGTSPTGTRCVNSCSSRSGSAANWAQLQPARCPAWPARRPCSALRYQPVLFGEPTGALAHGPAVRCWRCCGMVDWRGPDDRHGRDPVARLPRARTV